MSWRPLEVLRAIGVPRWAVWGACGFGLLVPLIFFGLGLWILIDTQRFVAAAVEVEAEVVRIDVSRDEDGTWYRPVFAVPVPDGRVAEAVLPGMDGAPRHVAGDVVTVLWTPERPNEVRLPGTWSLYGDGVVLLLLGMVSEVILAVALWKLVLRAPPMGPPGGGPPGGLPGGLRDLMSRHATDAERRAAIREELRNRRR